MLQIHATDYIFDVAIIGYTVIAIYVYQGNSDNYLTLITRNSALDREIVP
jgi:hypothetical protein